MRNNPPPKVRRKTLPLSLWERDGVRVLGLSSSPL